VALRVGHGYRWRCSGTGTRAPDERVPFARIILRLPVQSIRSGHVDITGRSGQSKLSLLAPELPAWFVLRAALRARDFSQTADRN